MLIPLPAVMQSEPKDFGSIPEEERELAVRSVARTC